VTATISNPTDGAVLGTATASTSLSEGDAAPVYSVSADAASATEGKTLSFTVQRSLAAGEGVLNSETVNWSANGQSGQLTFAAGDTSATFHVTTTDDQVWGSHSPNVTATISNPTDGAVLGTATASTSLSEGDAAPVFSLSGPTTATKGTSVTYTVTRSLAPGESVANTETVNWGASGTAVTNPSSGTLTFLPTDTSETFTVPLTNANNKSVIVSISSPSDGAQLGTSQVTTTDPAGIAGQPINLGLAASATDHIGAISATIAGVQSGWTISEGTDNGDGTWTVQTNNIAALNIASPASYTGALVLNIAESWTNVDGSIGHATVIDNVEAYAPGSAIFALSGDDNLTGSSGHDMFVFSQPIGHDVIYNFDAASDQIDLIGYSDFTGFGDVLAHTANDAAGNALITLGNGQSIMLNGVDAASLTASDFVFDQTPVMENAGQMVISDGAILPLSGTIDNTGCIALNSSGNETNLQVLARGLTLHGGGQVTLSDNSQNVVFAGDPSAVLTNIDNTISGAGQVGAGQLTLTNQGTIDASGTNALVIDTGANVIANAGTLQATGTGGLTISSPVANTGLIWANGGNVNLAQEISGGTALISGSAQMEFIGGSSAAVKFDAGANGTLALDASAQFTGTIAGFGSGAAIDLKDFGFGNGATLTYTAQSDGAAGILAVTSGSATEGISFVGTYSQSDFQVSADTSGGVLIRHT
jgi:hypothetical protein